MRYFDKDFLKFTIGFLAIIALGLTVISLTSLYLQKGEYRQTAQSIDAES